MKNDPVAHIILDDTSLSAETAFITNGIVVGIKPSEWLSSEYPILRGGDVVLMTFERMGWERREFVYAGSLPDLAWFIGVSDHYDRSAKPHRQPT